MTDAKLKSFAERLLKVRADAKEDADAILEEASGADINLPGLRRLAAWMGKDEKKRTEQEAVDDQMRFLAGLLPEPVELPPDGPIATARALFADKLTIRQVADAMKISVGKAHQLKTLAAMFTVQEKMNVNTETPKTMGHNSRRAITPCWTIANSIAEQERKAKEEARAKREAKRAELAKMMAPPSAEELDALVTEHPPFLRRQVAA